MYLIQCNEGPYLLDVTRWAIVSLAKCDPHTPVRLILFDSTGVYDRQISTWHPAITIEHYTPDVPIDKSLPGYFFTHLTFILEHALNTSTEDILSLDGDVIVRRPMAQVFDDMGDADFAMRFRPSLELHGPLGSTGAVKFNSGVLAIRQTPMARTYVRRVREIVEEYLHGLDAAKDDEATLVYIDQEALWLAYEELRQTGLKMHPLNDLYNDSYYTPDAYLWHAKGTARQHAMYTETVRGLRLGWRDVFGSASRARRAVVAKHNARLAKTAAAQAEATDTFFTLTEDEMNRARGILRNGTLCALSSDFLCANPALIEAASHVECIDWDPPVFTRNADALSKRGIAHRFTDAPRDVSFQDVALCLTDLSPAPKDVPTIIKNPKHRFSDHSVARRLNTLAGDWLHAPAEFQNAE